MRIVWPVAKAYFCKRFKNVPVETKKDCTEVLIAGAGSSGLLLGDNLRDGIGMGHRMTQATHITRQIINKNI